MSNPLKKLGKFLNKNVFDKAEQFVKDHPYITAALVLGGGAYLAGAFAAPAAAASTAGSTSVAGVSGISTVGSMAGAGTAAGTVGYGAAATPLVSAPVASGGVTGILGTTAKGAGVIGSTLFGSPTAAAATTAGLSVGGQMLSAQAQMEEQDRMAKESRDYQTTQFQRQLEAGRVSFAPQARDTAMGVIRRAYDQKPLQMTPSQALQLRRTNQL